MKITRQEWRAVNRRKNEPESLFFHLIRSEVNPLKAGCIRARILSAEERNQVRYAGYRRRVWNRLVRVGLENRYQLRKQK